MDALLRIGQNLPMGGHVPHLHLVPPLHSSKIEQFCQKTANILPEWELGVETPAMFFTSLPSFNYP